MHDHPESITIGRKFKRLWRRLETSSPVLTVKRRIRHVFGSELRHFIQVRPATIRVGGWTFASDLPHEAVAYCFGVGEDVTTELALIERFQIEVHAFDPTPRAVAWLKARTMPAGFHFHEVGVAGFDGSARFSPSPSPTNPSFSILPRPVPDTSIVQCEVRKLSTLVRLLGGKDIEILKLDIEGAEYAVIDDLVMSDLRPTQILVEFHHRFRGVERGSTTRAVRQLNEAGYLIFYISPKGHEYSFIRNRVSRSPDKYLEPLA